MSTKRIKVGDLVLVTEATISCPLGTRGYVQRINHDDGETVYTLLIAVDDGTGYGWATEVHHLG